MQEIRERTKDETIKVKGKPKKGPVAPDMRRQMMAKFGKELVKQRSRDEGSSNDTVPEAQAVEQTEEQAFAAVEGIRGYSSGISMAVRYERKRKIKERTAPPVNEAPQVDTNTGRTISPAHDRPPQAKAPGKRPETPPRVFRERMRQTAVKDKRIQHKQQAQRTEIRHVPDRQTQRVEIRQRTDVPKERPVSAPLRERNTLAESAPPPPPPTPQERMRQKAVSELRTRRIRDRAIANAPRSEYIESPIYAIESKAISPSTERKDTPAIKERPRRSFSVKDKQSGGAFVPKTRNSAAAPKTAVPKPIAPKATASNAKPAARPLEQAKRHVQRNAQRKLLRQSGQAAKLTAELTRKAAATVGKAVSAGISAIAGLMGGTVLVAVICVVIIIAGILASPFGILFSNEPSPNTVPLNVAVGNLNMELSNTLDALQDGDYDSIDVQGHGPDWREVVAVFAVKTAGADNGVDVAALTPDRFQRLRAVFWDMCIVDSSVETIDHDDSDTDDDVDDSWTEYILHISVTAKTADDMRSEYAFTEAQNEALTELLNELAAMELLITDLTSCDEQARELMDRLPDDLDPTRRAVVETACTLVGKVTYFWGGKSYVIGWDSRWGTIQKVTSPGSKTTGTYLPYGLDCSGFVDWVFYNVTDGEYIIGHGGGAMSQHMYCDNITWDEAQPGDLVFYRGDTHVGIVGGWDEDGNLLIVHCASGWNNVIITDKTGFVAIGRPKYYSE